jgi:hypothetical protein
MVTLSDLYVRHDEQKTFRQSISWLYQSGNGATRQLYRYRHVRLPDMVFAGWLASCGYAWLARKRWPTALALPVAYLGVAAGGHVGRAFVWEPRRPHRMAGATVVDTGLLAAYFVGRSVGLVRFARTRST